MTSKTILNRATFNRKARVVFVCLLMRGVIKLQMEHRVNFPKMYDSRIVMIEFITGILCFFNVIILPSEARHILKRIFQYEA